MAFSATHVIESDTTTGASAEPIDHLIIDIDDSDEADEANHPKISASGDDEGYELTSYTLDHSTTDRKWAIDE